MNEENELRQIYHEDTATHLKELSELAESEPLDLAEVCRILHAMEGAAGVMRLDNLRSATLDLCRRIENDPTTKRLVATIKVLAECNDHLSTGESLEERPEEIVRRAHV